jgi:hypothetical protein
MGKELRKIPGRFPIHDASQYALEAFAVKSNLKMSPATAHIQSVIQLVAT